MLLQLAAEDGDVVLDAFKEQQQQYRDLLEGMKVTSSGEQVGLAKGCHHTVVLFCGRMLQLR